jgi:hypothetical protein
MSHTTYKKLMTNKFRFWAPKASNWTLDPIKYTFLSSQFVSIKFYIKSSPKTLKLVNISRESEKGAKNSYRSYPTEFVPKVQKLIGSIGDQISH